MVITSSDNNCAEESDTFSITVCETADNSTSSASITENDIKDGMFSLLNRGIIPRDVDLTPAFERG